MEKVVRETESHIYFWGGYLSNWYRSEFRDGDYVYILPLTNTY